MSRNRLFAGLFLVLGTADLALLNLWLVPAAWPPSSDPIATPTTPAVLERTTEVEVTSARRRTGKSVSQGGLGVDSADGTEPPQVASVLSRAANAEVKLKEPNETPAEPRGELSLNAAEEVESQQVAAVVSDLTDIAAEPEKGGESPAGQEGDEPLAEAPEAVERQQGAAVSPQPTGSGVEPDQQVESAVEPDESGASAVVEPAQESSDPGRTGQRSSEPQHRTIHHMAVRFDFGKATLTSAARDLLRQTALLYQEHPDAEIKIDGHTDRIGSKDFNYRLSERRAVRVAASLKTQGVPAERIQVYAHGPSQSLNAGGSAAARALNRRVEITIRSRLP